MRLMITDDLWDHFGPLVEQAKRYKCGQPPKLPERLFWEALLYWARTGIPWRDLPETFAAWDAVYNRYRRWISSGSLRRLFELLTDQPRFGDIRRVLIDSTIIRAHPHAAGAPRKAKKLGAQRSARAQGLGRSRGGFTTKVMLTGADEDTAIAVKVIPGQAGDAPQLEPMLKQTLRRVPVIEELAGDKGFDGDRQRRACLRRGIFPNIPNRKNRLSPWPFKAEGYRARNAIERLIGKMKQFRRVATRYEKLRQTFQGVIQLVLGFIRCRRIQKSSIVNTT